MLPLILWRSFSLGLSQFAHTCADQYSAHLEGILLNLQNPLCAVLSSLLPACPVAASCVGLPGLSPPCLPN